MSTDPLERLRPHDPAERLTRWADNPAPESVLRSILADGSGAEQPSAPSGATRRAGPGRGLPTVGALAVALAVAAYFLFAGPHRTGGPSRSTDAPAARPAPAQRAQLEALERHAHRLDTDRATLLTPGDPEQLWLMPSHDGRELCLAQTRVGFTAAGQGSGFSCQRASDARRRGIVSGVPGDWYGWAPPGQQVVRGTTPGGADVQLRLLNGTFHVPAPVRKLRVGQTATRYLPLPVLRPQARRQQVLAAFALLRGTARRASAQEATLAQVQATQPLVLEGARTIAGGMSAGPLLAAPSQEGGVCLAAISGGACVLPVGAPEAGAALTVPVPPAEGGGWRSFGLVPDGVRRVMLVGADAPSSQREVHANGWSALTDQPPVAVAWTDAKGDRWSVLLGAARK